MERLVDAARPILILQMREGTDLAPEVGMGLPWVGAYLPTTAFHLKLMDSIGRAVVSTSGNASGEPILTSLDAGMARLHGIADGYLLHDRPILRGVDDSVVRFSGRHEIVLRRARGLAPLPVKAPFEVARILGVGGHQKVALALGMGDRVAVGPHIGDLESRQTFREFVRQAADLPLLLGGKPEAVACDLHPSYASSRWSRDLGLPLAEIQHHHAHIVAVMGEAGLDAGAHVLGIAWDGTGWGRDGRIWGGEFLRCGYGAFERLAAFLPFALLGGEKAAEEPRRVALALCHRASGRDIVSDVLGKVFDNKELQMLFKMLEGKSLESTAAGRLFDGFSCLILGCTHNRYEGEGPMRLEAACSSEAETFPPAEFIENFEPKEGEPEFWIDWRPWVRFVIERRGDRDVGRLAAGFHEAMAEAAWIAVERIRARREDIPLAAGGGCFQNARLVQAFRSRFPGLLLAQALPPNDGGLSYGQVLAGQAMLHRALQGGS